jgi:hypothetical protein
MSSASTLATLPESSLAQAGHRLAQQRARPPALVDQALDQSQLVDLLGRIHPLAAGVAQRLRKTVATFPDAQGVLAEPGVALHRGDAEASGG